MSKKQSAVVIVGGGVAGLEALIALRTLLGDRVGLTLVSQDEWFVDRPVTVTEPFGLGSAARHSLPDIATEFGAEFVGAAVEAVAADEHRVSCAGGRVLAFDTLILAPGARLRAPFADAVAFGLAGSDQAMRDVLDRLAGGEAQSVAFVAPRSTGWLLPLYELALMTARDLARRKVDGVRLSLITPEERPLALFGDQSSASVDRLLSAAGIDFEGSARATVEAGQVALGDGEPEAFDCVVTLPLMTGPGLAGVPATEPDGFVPVDEYGRVQGLPDVYGAGDVVDFPVKQGGLAAQQADTIAAHVARSHGADIDAPPFRPALRGMLFTGDAPQFMRAGVTVADPDVSTAWFPLWWPPTKVAGRYLAPYLFERADEEGFGVRPQGFVDVDIPLTASSLPG
jgi:sulfide:quinone oxidoreductase